MSEPVVVACPRCRASGGKATVVIQDSYGVCTTCNTTWQRGSHHEMIALDPDEEKK